MVDRFQATAYDVDRIVRALTADIRGNLIFKDDLNPDGITLSRLVQGLIASNVTFDSDGTFFGGVTTAQDALEYLNQFAYQTYTGRFVYVDPTIDSSQTVAGQIYADIKPAVDYADGLITNGYNFVHILIMGSHLQDANLDVNNDLGVYEYDDIDPILITGKGIKLIGVGNPTIRFKNINSTTRQTFFIIGQNSSSDLSVIMQDINFEFDNCTNVSAVHVVNAPANVDVKQNSGVFLDGISASFLNGTGSGNRVLDIRNTSSPSASNIIVKNMKLGSLYNMTPSSDAIELVYINHHAQTVLSMDGFDFTQLEQPNSVENTDDSYVTTMTAVRALSSRLNIENARLDEKMYWNRSRFADIMTKFLELRNTVDVNISNVSVKRESDNAVTEGAGGATSLLDWIIKDDTVTLNSQGGFDEIYTLNIVPIDSNVPAPSGVPTTGAGTTGTTGTSGDPGYMKDVKPVKGFYNDDELIFGLGDKNELRLGLVDDVSSFNTYNVLRYGVPFWVNNTTRDLQYFDGTNVVTIGQGSASATVSTTEVRASDWLSGTFAFPGEPSYSAYSYIVEHNLSLSNRFSFTITVFDDATGRVVQPKDVVVLDSNRVRVIMETNVRVWVSISG
jgi:hypothetical protein